MKNFTLQQFCSLILIALASLILISCSTHEIQKSTPLNPRSAWILLPFINHSDTPEAGERVADICATLLRSQHKINLQATHLPENDQQLPELNQQKLLDKTIQWGKEQQYQYGLGGSVQEYRYKSGLDGEPAVGITLNVINLTTGEVVWSASGAKTGWGRESVSGTAQQLIADLLNGLQLTE